MWFRRVILLFCLTAWALAAPSSALALVEDISRFERITYGDEFPVGPCIPGKAIHISMPGGAVAVCNANGVLSTSAVEGSASGSIIGIGDSPSGINYIHYNTVTLINSCGLLGSVSHVNIIAGPSGVECILPDGNLLTTPGFYSIAIIDANLVTLTPSGGQPLNGEIASMAAIRGPLARIRVEWRDDVGWYTDLTSSVGYGEPFTSVCSSFGGSTNVSSSGSGTWIPHTLSCLIPANSITAGTVIDICVGLRMLTGSTAPALSTRFMANAVPIWKTNSETTLYTSNPGSIARHCIGIMGTVAPTASAAIYTGHNINVFDSQYSTVASLIGGPVLINTTIAQILTFESYLSVEGIGVNSLEQLYFDARGSRFAN